MKENRKLDESGIFLIANTFRQVSLFIFVGCVKYGDRTEFLKISLAKYVRMIANIVITRSDFIPTVKL